MPLKCSNRFKIALDHMRLSFNEVNMEFWCKKYVKYQYARRAVCAYARVFRKRPGCALIGTCALIRTNAVIGKPQKKNQFCQLMEIKRIGTIVIIISKVSQLKRLEISSHFNSFERKNLHTINSPWESLSF